jgi:hypothetical protein
VLIFQNIYAIIYSGVKVMNKYVKYPSTPHVPWSESVTEDDFILRAFDKFEGQRVIVSEKMDGESCTMYNDHIHARSIDSKYHPSRTWVKSFWAGIKDKLKDDMRICGENLYAKHSISYDSLPSYFLGFSIWQGTRCLDWNTTLSLFRELGITPVPVIYDGIFDLNKMKNLTKFDRNKQEGYVIRVARSFTIAEFPECMAKYVRKNHVQTSDHWMHSEVVPNKLKD